MNNFALTTDGRSVAKVEAQLSKYLPGLDVRLWPFGVRQAVIRAPIVRAIEIEYPNIGAGPLLKVLGIEDIRLITDEETVALIAGRDVEMLPTRPVVQVASTVPGVDWHLAAVNAPQAWQLLGGPDHINWGGVRVGHIDTGYTEHPVFGFPQAPWIDVAQARSFMPIVDNIDASMFPPELGPGQDTLTGAFGGHGTRIASTICGHAPNAPGGPFFGIAPKVPLVPVRITDSVWINHAQREFAQALNHLVGPAKVGVVNVSLGVFLSFVESKLKAALNAAYDAGVIVVCAAGNHVNSVVAPARLSRTLAVGGVTVGDVPWGGSSYGPEVDFSAPAADLRRANASLPAKFKYGGGGDGTSYATALTTGAAALWLAHHGAALNATYALPWQRVEAFRVLATQTTRKPSPWNPGAFGTGVIDVEALLKAPLPHPTSLQEAPKA